MARFQAIAEFRRIHRDAEWTLQGAWARRSEGETAFANVDDGRASNMREVEAELVRWENLGTVLAPDADAAALIGLQLATGDLWERPGIPGYDFGTVRIEIPPV